MTTAPHIVPAFDLEQVRKDFPILSTLVNGKPLCYLDNGATTQKPQAVIDLTTRYYAAMNSNVHRGVHYLSDIATRAYEAVRDTTRVFLNAEHRHEILFTRGTTEGINLVASSFGRRYLQAGDVILVSGMEHHSNIVPWQLAAANAGATVLPIPITDSGTLDLDALDQLLHSHPVRILAVTHVSNSLGTINPLKDIIRRAHAAGVPVLVDGAQATPHMAVDVQALDADFYAFSGHKVFGPTGVGVLYGKEKYLNEMPPFLGGGDMIRTVSFSGSTWNDLPFKFEAGTPNIAGVIGLGAALEYVQGIGYAAITTWEAELLRQATAAIEEIGGIRIIGTAPQKAAVLSLWPEWGHPADLGSILDMQGIAIRAGHHCTQPVMERFGLPATARASFAFYNTTEDVHRLAEGLRKAKRMLA